MWISVKIKLKSLLKDELNGIKACVKSDLSKAFPWKVWAPPFNRFGWVIFYASPVATIISLYILQGILFLVSVTLFLIFYWKLFLCLGHTLLYVLSRPILPIIDVMVRQSWVVLMLYSLYIPLRQIYIFLREGYWGSISVIDGLEPLLGSQIRLPPADWIGLHEVVFNFANSLNFGVFLFCIALWWFWLLSSE